MKDEKKFTGQDPELEEEFVEEEEERPRRRGCGIAAIVIMVLFVALLLGGGWMLMSAMDEIAGDNSLANKPEVTVSIAEGEGPSVIADKLQKAGVIDHALYFKVYLKLSGKASSLQYGEFTLKPGIGYDELIEKLSQYRAKATVRVTIPEGSTIFQFASRMEEAGLCSADEFIREANEGDFSDIEFWSRIDTDPDTFMKGEGYLFPETYEFYSDATVHDIVHKLYAQFDKEITPEMYDRMAELNLSLREVVTLASLVQEEAGEAANQPGVSGVFHNRLKPESPYPRMGSDVTWYYLDDFVFPYYGGEDATPVNIKNAYYTGDNDPNSRIGLPAGPLSSPGRDALHAALYPEESDYYFFLTDSKGNYYYGKTYDEHLANIEKAKKVNNG